MKPPIFHRWTDYDLSRLPNAFLRDQEAGATGQKDWVAKTGYSVGYPAWGLLYSLAACRLQPNAHNLVVETGTNIGSSSIVLAQAIHDAPCTGVLRTVEIDKDNHARAVENVRAAGLSETVEFFLGDAIQMLPEMVAGEDPLTVAFLDGSHLAEQVIREFEIIEPRLDPTAVVIFDNTYPLADEGEDPRVHGALKDILARFGGNLINLPHCSWYTPGVAIWQRKPFDGWS